MVHHGALFTVTGGDFLGDVRVSFASKRLATRPKPRRMICLRSRVHVEYATSCLRQQQRRDQEEPIGDDRE